MNLKNVVYLKLNYNNFYEAYNDDAYVVAYIMKYKLVSFGVDSVKVGFPSELLNEVISFLRKNRVSYYVSDNPNLRCNFGRFNRYSRFLRKDMPINSLYKVKPKKYSGTFSIIYEYEHIIYNFIIGKNINADAEVVKKVYNHEVNSIVTLNSGIRFKIIRKNMKYK